VCHSLGVLKALSKEVLDVKDAGRLNWETCLDMEHLPLSDIYFGINVEGPSRQDHQETGYARLPWRGRRRG
jgi:hypothetical protein